MKLNHSGGMLSSDKQSLLSEMPVKTSPASLQMDYGQNRLLKWCPKCNRWKLLSAVVLVIVMVIMIYYNSMSGASTKNMSSNSGQVNKDMPSLPGDPIFNRIRYKHTNRRLPQCIIIGARKAGTRALLTFLNYHSDIMAAKNEVHYFDRDENYSLGSDWYRRQMPYSFPGQITVEKSPAYFHEELVPERIHRFNNSLKLLLIVRDPVKRAISDYYQLYLKARAHGRNGHKFEDLALDHNGNVNAMYDVLQRSMYSKHLKRWLKYFGLRQIHIVNGEAFTQNPSSELVKVERFLGLQSQLTPDKFYFNKTKMFYCYRFEGQQKCLGDDKGRPHPHVDPSLVSKLKRFFTKYNKRFYKVTGRDFGWDDGVDEEDDDYDQNTRS